MGAVESFEQWQCAPKVDPTVHGSIDDAAAVSDGSSDDDAAVVNWTAGVSPMRALGPAAVDPVGPLYSNRWVYIDATIPLKAKFFTCNVKIMFIDARIHGFTCRTGTNEVWHGRFKEIDGTKLEFELALKWGRWHSRWFNRSAWRSPRNMLEYLGCRRSLPAKHGQLYLE